MELFHVTSMRKSGDKLCPDGKLTRSYVDNPDKTIGKYYEQFQTLMIPFEKVESRLINFIKSNQYSDIEKITGKKPSKWACEAIFEKIRIEIEKEYNESLPSRLTSTYLCYTLEDACTLKNEIRNGLGDIYTVKVPKKNYKMFDMNYFTVAENRFMFPLFENIERMEGINNEINDKIKKIYNEVSNLAMEYWKGCSTECIKKEILYDKEITLGKKICLNDPI